MLLLSRHQMFFRAVGTEVLDGSYYGRFHDEPRLCCGLLGMQVTCPTMETLRSERKESHFYARWDCSGTPI